MSVKNFSPYLLDIFKCVSEKGEFKFECKSNKAALALKARLYGLRKAMREEKHWLLPIAEACSISITNGKTIYAHRPDAELESALEKALKEQGYKGKKVA